jgi:hypothetical protein
MGFLVFSESWRALMFGIVARFGLRTRRSGVRISQGAP